LKEFLRKNHRGIGINTETREKNLVRRSCGAYEVKGRVLLYNKKMCENLHNKCTVGINDIASDINIP